MKKNLCLLLPGMLALALLTGCLSQQQDSGQKTEAPNPTIGQQMNDLLKARNSGSSGRFVLLFGLGRLAG